MTAKPRVVPITAAKSRNRRARYHQATAEPRPPRRYRIARTITRNIAAAADNIAALFCRWDDHRARIIIRWQAAEQAARRRHPAARR